MKETEETNICRKKLRIKLTLCNKKKMVPFVRLAK